MNEMIANRYALVRLIGEGGMASVYLAVDTILKREVAVKVLRGDLSKDNTSLVRFQREANAATKLSHPNIVEVYDVGEDHGKNFIVMEYVKGRTLKDLVRQRGALAKEEAVNIMRQLVSSVMAAHKNGIIHRDIKSQNVLIKDDGTVKLSDFGIALAADAVQLTQTDVIVGSVHYLAPELARGEQATQQSDIYALGIVFYEMLTGDVPHHGDAPVQVALKHLREQIPSVRDFNPDIPQSIDNIIRKATVKNRMYRYPTAAAMY
ncbi:MAG: serine/threonine protein kinase, partial [Erysipelotrichales bacterium]|nr:serine/threonine protein kinase [Erysipelotrichales bacterium]